MIIMSFQSLNFIIFFAVALICVSFVPQKLKNGSIAIFSLVFSYLAGGIITTAFLLLAAGTTFFAALGIEKTADAKIKKLYFLLALLLNIALLFVLKYSAFFINFANDFNRLVGLERRFEHLSLFVPLGISFYTLSVLGYLIDIYWGSYKSERNFINYSIFAGYFPVLFSGPIVRYPEMSRELLKKRTLNLENTSQGILRICWGFFEKTVISDTIASFVKIVYSDHLTYSGIYIFIGTVCFAIQLYTDFCGYMDIALGCSKLLDIKLPENFDTPFFSRSLSEYWRRWHITLGLWFKDYLLYPLLKSNAFIAVGEHTKKVFGKKTGKKIPVYLALAVLWFSVGFWHGGVWKYIIGSGLLHCFYIVTGQIFENRLKKITVLMHIPTESVFWKIFQRLRTFFMVLTGFVFFRSADVPDALQKFKYCFVGRPNITLPQFLADTRLSKLRLFVLAVSIVLLFCVSVYRQNKEKAYKLYNNKIFCFVASWLLVMGIFLFASANSGSFIYFGF
ncbi:MAG: MBOAT family O-acyltransferase [Treponema sp.]